MSESFIYFPCGHLRKPNSAETRPCIFRGPGVECPKDEFNTEKCDSCGWNPLVEKNRKEKILSGEEEPVESNIYDVEEIHPDCTVQILRNTVTGEQSVGWWENKGEDNA